MSSGRHFKKIVIYLVVFLVLALVATGVVTSTLLNVSSQATVGYQADLPTRRACRSATRCGSPGYRWARSGAFSS